MDEIDLGEFAFNKSEVKEEVTPNRKRPSTSTPQGPSPKKPRNITPKTEKLQQPKIEPVILGKTLIKAGTPIKTGTTPIKAGTIHIKTGTTPINTETTPIKTGTTPIKGTTLIKAGTTPINTETTPINTGTTPVKTGTPIKTGTTPTNTGTTPVKTGTTPIKTQSPKPQATLRWIENKKPTAAEIAEFDKKAAIVNKRPVIKSNHLLKISPSTTLSSDILWRKPTFRGNTTFHVIHTTIQTCFGWSDTLPHRFLTQNGLEIGKIQKGRLNERKITISQVMPSTAHQVTYQYGQALDLLIKVEEICEQDTLPSPRLCAGKGLSPPETITTSEEYELWVKKSPEKMEFCVDDVNCLFLGNKTIKYLSGMRKTMDEDEAKSFQMSQMAMFPSGSLGSK